MFLRKWQAMEVLRCSWSGSEGPAASMSGAAEPHRSGPFAASHNTSKVVTGRNSSSLGMIERRVVQLCNTEYVNLLKTKRLLQIAIPCTG